jgi:hypothetical protein
MNSTKVADPWAITTTFDGCTVYITTGWDTTGGTTYVGSPNIVGDGSLTLAPIPNFVGGRGMTFSEICDPVKYRCYESPLYISIANSDQIAVFTDPLNTPPSYLPAGGYNAYGLAISPRLSSDGSSRLYVANTGLDGKKANLATIDVNRRRSSPAYRSMRRRSLS